MRGALKYKVHITSGFRGDVVNATQEWLADNAMKVLDSVVDAIITIDAGGSIQSVNKGTETLFGYTADELLGQQLVMLMPEPHRSMHQQYVNNFLGGAPAQIIGIGRELTAQTKSGKVFPIYLAVSEIKTDNGSYFAGIVRDLSQSKADQKALLEQRERLARVGRLSIMGEMTASIAHEINQPLTAIAAYAQACQKLLEKDDCDLARVRDGLRKLGDQSLRAGAVIERIQRFVRHEGNQKEMVDINTLMRDLMHFGAADARLHSIDLKIDLEEGLPLIYCDPVQVQQVALNLIRNAIDAMAEIDFGNGPQILLHTRARGGGVEIAVVDEGPGVDEGNEPLIFSPFHTTKKEGMGMGLSICRSIVREHGGELSFRNNEGHGSTFYFYLPTGDEHE